MDTREVAAYLRLKERRIYDLVRRNALPYVRATGKLLFPRAQIDAWLAGKAGAPTATAAASTAAPAIIAGSHDPLLDWAARESRSSLAVLACGSSAGLDRFAAGNAMLAAMHWLDTATGEYNVPLVRARLGGQDVVVIEWARRVQGLVLARGNPLRIRGLPDLAKKKARVIGRQPEAGSHRLLEHLLAQAGIAPGSLALVAAPRAGGDRSRDRDRRRTRRRGRRDRSRGARARSRVPAADHRAARPRAAPARLLRTAGAGPARVRAQRRSSRRARRALGGYDVGQTGRVVFNG